MRSYSELVDVLTAKEDALRLLQSILEEERIYIVELKTDKLNETTSRKEEVAAKISDLKERLRETLSRSFKEWGMSGEINLSPVIEKLRGPEKERLLGLQDSLILLSRKIEELLSGNRDLLNSSLRIVESSMSFFRRALSRSDTYGNAGHMTEIPAASRLVCKEI
ncbi:MAG TPA: flagellar protein FlgN [Geobacteraceae bacterium]|nr:flagellar protein FlgN [Geobacteraceae bacterium]